MCKLIAELLGTNKDLLRESLHRLENNSGAPGIDVRLTGEIYGKLHMKMRSLGLDPNDTTPRELYQALLNLVALHDTFISRRIGVSAPTEPESVLKQAIFTVNTLYPSKQAWALKQVTAKRLLKAMPPKNLMRLLHYRSVDSLLKREPAAMLLAASRHTEPVAWQHKFVGSYKRLRPGDFETRDIEVVYLGDKGWKQVATYFNQYKPVTVIHVPEAASIAVLPVLSRSYQGLALFTMLLLMHYINEIKTYSTMIKFHQMRPDFGKFLVESVLSPSSGHAKLAGQPIHWRIIHRYYGRGDQQNHPEIFEPHLQREDLAYRKAEALLYTLEPALHFWHDMDYVGLPQSDGNPISFSLTDMAMNLMNRSSYENRVFYHMQASLWNEIYLRYMTQPTLERQVLQQLDEKVISDMTIVHDMEFVW